jgi:hypothetical protein
VRRLRPRYLGYAALFLLILPFVLAFLTSLWTDGDMWNEGTGGGAWLWLLFLTFPLAMLMLIAAAVWWLIKDIRRRGQ